LGIASYDFICPTCNASIKLKNRHEIRQSKELNTATTKYHNEKLPFEDYKQELSAFSTDVFGSSNGPETVDAENYEGASGSIIRTLFALLFAFAILTATIGAVNLNPTALGYGLLALPYLVIRYWDSTSTTIPFAGYVKN
jgi:hypothetical protein